MHFLRDYKKASPKEKKKLLMDYKMMQHMRMGIYDISDVAYDSFLLNGSTKYRPWRGKVNVGDVVRLRFIGAAGNTFYHVKIPNTLMRVVHIQGNDVKPYLVKDFKIGPGETVDVLVKIKEKRPYVIYAESADTLGFALGALVISQSQLVDYKNITPFPEPKPTTREKMKNEMMRGVSHMHMPMSGPMQKHKMHHGHSMQKARTIGTKYQNLTAAVKTNRPDKPVYKTIQMKLSGFMDRFIWFVNDVPGYMAKPILLKPNKRYRVVFTNTTMMHHPMHIHGHWFILRNGHGSYDPLLHTIDVPPGSQVIADLDTDASGQWFFHCHMLYHMIAGMSRVFQYSTLIELTQGKIKPQTISKSTRFINRPIVRVDELHPIPLSLVRTPSPHPMGRYLATFLDIGNDFSHNRQTLSYNGLFGSDFHKLELFTDDAEIRKGRIENADIDIFYWQPGIGIEGLMQYFIDTNLRAYYHRGSVKLDIELSRDTQIGNNFLIRTGVRGILASKSIPKDEIGHGLNEIRLTVRPYYRLAPGLSVFAEYEHEQAYGALKRMHQNTGDAVKTDSFFLGLSLLF